MMTREMEEGTLQHAGGRIPLRLFKNDVSTRIASEILTGKTYPQVPFVSGVKTIVDIGANVGAASIYFALMYPHATVYALEPSGEPFALLSHNVASLSNVKKFQVGLFSENKIVSLYPGKNDSVESSVCSSSRTYAETEQVQLRSAGEFIRELGIDTIDILKIDTEGCEVHILRSLREFLASMKLIYVEYHSDRDRRLIDELLAVTHVLWRGRVEIVYRGEFCYLQRQLVPGDNEVYSTEIAMPLQG